MKVLDVIIACHGRINGGDPYLWHSFGPNANYLEFRDADGQGYAHCIYDTENYGVYYIHCEIPGQDQCFQWINPDYETEYFAECLEHNTDPRIAYDDVEYDETVKDETQILRYLTDVGATYYDDMPIKKTSMTLKMPGTIGGAKIVFPNE